MGLDISPKTKNSGGGGGLEQLGEGVKNDTIFVFGTNVIKK